MKGVICVLNSFLTISFGSHRNRMICLMRKLASLCRQLNRYGYQVAVVSPKKGFYIVHYSLGVCAEYPSCFYEDHVLNFHSVREATDFLYSLFRVNEVNNACKV